jgi:hypothetical protein
LHESLEAGLISYIMKKMSSANSAPVNGLSPRKFIRSATLAAGPAAFSFPYVGKVPGVNDRINPACIGCGGKGDSDTSDAATRGANIIALCDVDELMMNKKVREFSGKFPKIKSPNLPEAARFIARHNRGGWDA